MAYTGTICAEAEINFFAGENVDATGNTEANHNYLVGYAEAFLGNLVKYDIVTNWGSLNSTKKKLFSEWAARFAAIGVIQYNMAGYSSRIEAEDMINIHYARLKEIQDFLEKEDFKNYIGV
jgi:hypothetical protein